MLCNITKISLCDENKTSIILMSDDDLKIERIEIQNYFNNNFPQPH